MYIAKMVAGLLTLPACLHAYGQERYGVYLICFGLSVSMASFDFGGSKSIFRYAVEYESDQDKTKFMQALSTGITFNALSSVLIAIIILVMGVFSSSLFNLTAVTQNESFVIFSLAAVNAVILTIGTIPINILNANKYFHQRNVLQCIPLGLNLLLIVYLFIDKTFPLINFSILIVMLTLLSFLLDLLLVKRKSLIKNIPIRLVTDKSLFTSHNSGYNYRVLLISLVSFLAVQADKIIIASFFSVASVTIYTIISKPYFLLKGILAITYPVIQPRLSNLHIQSNRNGFTEFSTKIIRSSFLVFLLGICFISIFFKQALWIWLGTAEYNTYVIWGIVSMSALCITVLYGPFYRTLLYTDSINNLLNFSYISVSVNLLISILLTFKIGFQGVIIGTIAQIILEYFYLNYLATKKMYVDIKLIYTKKLMLAVVTTLGISISVYLLTSNFSDSAIMQIIFALSTVIIFILILYYFVRSERISSLFTKSETETVKLNPSNL